MTGSDPSKRALLGGQGTASGHQQIRQRQGTSSDTSLSGVLSEDLRPQEAPARWEVVLIENTSLSGGSIGHILVTDR